MIVGAKPVETHLRDGLADKVRNGKRSVTAIFVVVYRRPRNDSKFLYREEEGPEMGERVRVEYAGNKLKPDANVASVAVDVYCAVTMHGVAGWPDKRRDGHWMGVCVYSKVENEA